MLFERTKRVVFFTLTAVSFTFFTSQTFAVLKGHAPAKTSPAFGSTVDLIWSFNGSSVCSGVLLTERFVLSAAHCVFWSWTNKEGARQAAIVHNTHFIVYPGDDARSVRLADLKAESRATAKLHVHPLYDMIKSPAHDLVLIELDRPFAAHEARPIGLENVWSQTGVPAGTSLLASGFGLDEQRVSGQLREQQFELLGFSESGGLQLIMPKVVRGRNICSGDSGGPLFAQEQNRSGYHLVGIAQKLFSEEAVKESEFCAVAQSYFTPVAPAHAWIIETISLN